MSGLEQPSNTGTYPKYILHIYKCTKAHRTIWDTGVYRPTYDTEQTCMCKGKKNWHFCTNWPIFRACNRLHDRRALVSWKYNMHPMVRPRHWQENSAFEYFEQSFYLLLTKKCNNTCSKKSSKMNYIMLDLYTFWMFWSYLFQQHSL